MNKIKKILLLGSGALKIGEAGEFDYSGSQAIKALKEEGIKVVVVNPNIATYQTSKGLADEVYFVPVNAHFVKRVIDMEQPDGILLSFGGQTALNCGLELYDKKIITDATGTVPSRKSTVPFVLGTPVSAIQKTEDRKTFIKTLQEVQLITPIGKAVTTVKNALMAAQKIGYPVIIRSAFSLGGLGSAFAKNKKELKHLAEMALSKTPQILVEEDLTGWKEVEYEVIRDKNDNCITVCNMENMDPMGVHTGESIVIAPSQTLTNYEYHCLREVAIKLIKHLGIIGECNIQYALRNQKSITCPQCFACESRRVKNQKELDIDYRIIEVNARLSRSSALASKATGYPLAYTAAKLALGYTLPELQNTVTKKTCSFFEPALDYVTVKMPRWDLDKFKDAEQEIGTQMKSVGEVMAIGRNFEEAIQKASRMLGIDQTGILASLERLEQKYPQLARGLKNGNIKKTKARLINLIKTPNVHRLLAITEALKLGVTPEEITKKSKIDLWFVEKIKNITDAMRKIKKMKGLNKKIICKAKTLGFSDKQIGVLINKRESTIANFRNKHNIIPKINKIDTLAAEYPAKTNYLYLTYPANNFTDSQKKPVKGRLAAGRKILIIGSGVYRIGSSVEFDWCAVTCGQVLRKLGYEVIMINHNPETVSTDYDMADKLYFEELNFETVQEIYNVEQPDGIVLSMGGQAANNIATSCLKAGMKILGTSPEDIDRAENRYKFSQLLTNNQINQPDWKELTTIYEAKKFARSVGYPVLIRPSYVLSGAAMNVAFNEQDFKQYLNAAAFVSKEQPVVVTKFIVGVKEIEVDAIAKGGKVIVNIISEHVENAGVHSGDATIVCPPQNIYLETARRIKIITRQIAEALNITGPFNIQFLARNNDIKVIECNLRASRSFPFVTKVTGINLIEIATKIMVNEKVGEIANRQFDLPHVGVKAPQFSFSRIKGADPVLSVEMASTGEVGALGDSIESAYLKSILSTGFKLPKRGVLLSLGGEINKVNFLTSAKKLYNSGFTIYATHHTSKFLRKRGVRAKKLHKLHDTPKEPNIKTFMLNKKIDLVISINDFDYKKPVGLDSYEVDDDYELRRTSVDLNVPILTDLQTAKLFSRAICKYNSLNDLKVQPWSSYK